MKSRELSPAERRFWILHKLYEGHPAYQGGHAIRIRGPLDEAVLAASIAKLSERYESLRTTFHLEKGEPLARIHGAPQVELHREEFHRGDQALAAAQDFLDARVRDEFNLARLPLVRFYLLKLSNVDHFFGWTVHHIAFDRWSCFAVGSRIGALYASILKGEEVDAPPAFSEVASHRWQAMQRSSEKRLAWWKAHLAAPISPLSIPSEKIRPTRRSLRGSRRIFDLPRKGLDALITSQPGLTLQQVLLAAFSTWLAHLTGREDAPILVPISNRVSIDERRVLGNLLNLLPLKIPTSRDRSLVEQAEVVRRVTWGAYRNQLPFEEIVRRLDFAGPESAIPSSAVLFQLQKHPGSQWPIESLEVSDCPVPDYGAKLDLSIDVAQTEAALRWDMEWSRDLFSAKDQKRLEASWMSWLQAGLEAPHEPLDSLWYERVLATKTRKGSVPEKPGVHDRSLIERIEDLADIDPARISVIDGDQVSTRADLVERVRRRATWLESQGIATGSEVGVCLPRSRESIVSLLALSWLGVTIRGFDPETPPRWIDERLGSTSLLTTREVAAKFPRDRSILVVEPVEDTTARRDPPRRNPAGLAYRATTSGTTGIPKTVDVSDSAARARAAWSDDCLPYGTSERVLHRTSLQFVDAYEETLGSLAHGATVVVLREADARDPRRLIRVLERDRVERVTLPPTLLRAFMQVETELLEPLGCLRYLICTGEPLPRDLAEEVLRRLPTVRLFNQYGTTEAAHALFTEIFSDAEFERMPLGSPTSGTLLRILDPSGEGLPAGAVGEIELSGARVAESYERDSGSQGFAGVVKTGDLGFCNEQGLVFLVGRADRKLNHRGVLLDPQEIEAALRCQPGVDDAVVVLLGDGRLAALLAGRDASIEIPAIRHSLGNRLPPAAVPLVFGVAKSLPRRVNGKLDLQTATRRLENDSKEFERRPKTRPLTPIETVVVGVWRRLLANDPDSRSFAECGGDSLLAIRLCIELQHHLGYPIPTSILYELTSGLEVVRHLDSKAQATLKTNRRALVRLAESRSTDRPALVLIPPAGGLSLGYRALADQLRWDADIHGFDYPGVLPDEVPLRSIREISAEAASQIEEQVSSTTRVVCGFSFGGLVAFDIALQLTDAIGRPTALLVIDTHPPSLGLRLQTLAIWQWRKLKRLFTHVEPDARAQNQEDRNAPLALTQLARVNKRARWRYRTTKRFEGPMVLISTTQARDLVRNMELSWQKLHRGPFLHVEVSGLHRDLLRSERLEELTAAVDFGLQWIDERLPTS